MLSWHSHMRRWLFFTLAAEQHNLVACPKCPGSKTKSPRSPPKCEERSDELCRLTLHVKWLPRLHQSCLVCCLKSIENLWIQLPSFYCIWLRIVSCAFAHHNRTLGVHKHMTYEKSKNCVKCEFVNHSSILSHSLDHQVYQWNSFIFMHRAKSSETFFLASSGSRDEHWDVWDWICSAHIRWQ